MQTHPHPYSRRRRALIVILVTVIAAMTLAMLPGCSQSTDNIASIGEQRTSDDLPPPAMTSASDSMSFGDVFAEELSGGVDLDEASCTVQVVITNNTDIDAVIQIDLDFDTSTSTEESVVPAHSRWHVAFVREQPIMALTLTGDAGLAGGVVNFTPDYSRCGGKPLIGVGDTQTLERITPETGTAIEPLNPVV